MMSSGRFPSFFVNPIGIILWAALAAVLYYNQLTWPACICLLFCLLFFLSWVWTKYSLSKVRIDAAAETQCAFPGGAFSITCQAANEKLLPLIWLELSFPLSGNGCALPVYEENSRTFFEARNGLDIPGACARIAWLLWHQEASMEIPMKAVHRGICRISKLTASSGDLLGLGIKEKEVELKAAPSLVVYPAVFPIEANSLIQSTSDMEAGKNGYMEDVTLLKMSRAYEPGDPVKKINWRQLAKQGSVSVNIYETVFPKLATFLIDLASFREGTKEKNSLDSTEFIIWTLLRQQLEDMLSLTASCILKLDDSGICCGLIVPGGDLSQCMIQYPGKHGSSTDELLYSLAAVDYQAEDVQIPIWDIADHFSLLGTLYIVTSSYKAMTVDPQVFSSLGNCAVLARYPSDPDDHCPLKLFLMDNLAGKSSV